MGEPKDQTDDQAGLDFSQWAAEPDFTDEELTELALATQVPASVQTDTAPWLGAAAATAGDLPSWYMPAAIGFRHSRRSRIVVLSIIVGFLVVDAFGLCITSGFITFA